MYAIYADGMCIHSDVFALDSTKAINPKLTLSDCAAGSLSMTLPVINAGYNTIERMITDITVEKDGKEIWMGRVLSESKDFWNNRVLYCEGELAFFNDSTQPPKQYSGKTIRGYLEALIDVHNSKVAANRRFKLGAVTVTDDTFPDFYTNYEKTMASINVLIETYGGHMRVRKENGERYLDYLKECPNTCSQTIQMGVNLIDFTKSWDMSEFATVIVPLGNRLEDSPIEALDAYLTVESVNNNSVYVQSPEAIAAYGWIEKTVSWEGVSDPQVLLDKAKEYLSELQFDNMVLELSALDMHYLQVDVEAVKLLDEIRVISLPHGLDRIFPVTKLEIPLDSPEKTQFKLGDTVQTSLTEVNNQINSAILDKIEALPKAHNILKEAKDNAAQIMNMATTGYITITKDEHGSDTLYISNVRDYTKATKLWKWNMNGLGYSKDGGKTYGLAITMDGAIVADYITAGVLNGNVLRTGVIQDYNGNVVFDLDTGKLTMKNGSIYLGAYDSTTKHYKFEVDEDGNVYAGSGVFAGTLAGAKGTFSGSLTAVDGTFTGTLSAAKISGALTAESGAELVGCAIYVPNKTNPKFKVDSNGNVSMTGSITWDSTNTPVQYQFSVTGTGSWHSTMTSSDMYRRDSLDGGKTWGSAYQFRGQDGKNGADGKNGSDASVTFANIKSALQIAASTQKTFITADSAGSPNIYGGNIYGSNFYGNDFNVIAESGANGGFNLYGYFYNKDYAILRIDYYNTGTYPLVRFFSPNDAFALWNFPNTTFKGKLDFKDATVENLKVTAVFG